MGETVGGSAAAGTAVAVAGGDAAGSGVLRESGESVGVGSGASARGGVVATGWFAAATLLGASSLEPHAPASRSNTAPAAATLETVIVDIGVRRTRVLTIGVDGRSVPWLKAVTSVGPVPSRPVEIDRSNLVESLLAFIRNDLGKVLRYAAVSVVTVPLGMSLLWLFLRSGMTPVLANLVGVTIATIPNYILNRYWVWAKRGANSVRREIAPFWAMAFLGLVISTIFVLIVGLFTDAALAFLAANFVAFGIVWVFKFFVLGRFLFGDTAAEPAAVTA